MSRGQTKCHAAINILSEDTKIRCCIKTATDSLVCTIVSFDDYETLKLTLYNFYEELTASRAVKFGEINSLPRAQQKRAVLTNNRNGRADAACFEMGCGISLEMAKLRTVRVGFIKSVQQIGDYIRVGIFIYCNSCGSVLTIYHSDTV